MPVKFTITCDHCGVLNSVARPLQFFRQEGAEETASRHVDKHPAHIVTGTRPAHNREGSIPVIVFTAKKQEAAQ
jgi:hypothetical protein